MLGRNATCRHCLLALAITACSAAGIAAPVRASSLTVEGSTTHTGLWAARVDVERTCSEDDRVVPDGTDYSGVAPEEACVSLQAGDVDVLSGADVTFLAGERIALGSGFSVASGASFRAVIDPQVTGDAFVESMIPEELTEYWARFYLLPNALDLEEGESLLHLVGYDGTGDRELAVGLTWNVGLAERRVFVQASEDDGGVASTKGSDELVLPDGWHFLEVRWVVSSGMDDGVVEVCVDDSPGGGLQCAKLSGLDNDASRIESVRWGVFDVPQKDLGTVFIDDFRSRRLGPIGGCSAAECP